MIKERSHSGYKIRKNRKRNIFNVALIVLVVVLLSLIPYGINKYGGRNAPNRRDLSLLWESSAYQEVFQISGEQLVQKPLDYFILTIHGFSAYQLAIAQINNFSMLNYINNCIWTLRRAMLLKEGVNDGRLFYVLGKAYYYKGTGYQDLVIKYLEMARDAGFSAKDIPEYLGLAYASVNDYQGSVAALIQASASNRAPSDLLLLSIANSYIALGEDDTATTYLEYCLETSRDSNMISAARLNLAGILSRKAEYAGAEELYNIIIEQGGNADAHYYLGELYNTRGDTVRALAQWRRAIQVDPSHRLARARLNL